MAYATARRSRAGFIPAADFVLLNNKTPIEAEERAMAATFGPEWDQ